MRSKNDKKKLLISLAAGFASAYAVYHSIEQLNVKISGQEKLLLHQVKTIQDLKKDGKTIKTINKGIEYENIYIIAKENIKAGEIIKEKHLDAESFKEPQTNTFVAPANAIGSIALNDIQKGQLIEKSNLADANFNKKTLEPGFRAITIPIDYIQGLASYFNIGSNVDILTVSRSSSQKSKVILENVQIIAFEPKAEYSNNNDSKAINAKQASAVTLQIPSDSSSEVVQAMQEGKILFVARGENEDNIIDVKNVKPTTNDLPSAPLNLETLDNLPMPAMPQEKPKTTKVELIQADVKTEIKFEDN